MGTRDYGLDDDLKEKLEKFFNANCFPKLYKGYNWRKDPWDKKDGFIEIKRIEERFLKIRKSRKPIKLDDILEVIDWGVPNWYDRVEKNNKKKRIEIKMWTTGTQESYKKRIPSLLNELTYLTGVGLVSATKVLRFADPKVFGVLDSRIVREFGDNGRKHNWLTLRAVKYRENDRYVIRGGDEANQYIRWLNILHYFAKKLNEGNGKRRCPHPEFFVAAGLRKKGVWTCADVEMALFRYAKPPNKKNHNKGCRKKR